MAKNMRQDLHFRVNFPLIKPFRLQHFHLADCGRESVALLALARAGTLGIIPGRNGLFLAYYHRVMTNIANWKIPEKNGGL